MIVYIDDGICASASESEAEGTQDIVVSDKCHKVHLEPLQSIDWLGFAIDLAKRRLF